MLKKNSQSSVRQEGVLVPHVVRCCVEEVERRGMDEVGIYRISGTTSEISMLKAAFNTSKKNIMQKNYLSVGKCSDKNSFCNARSKQV